MFYLISRSELAFGAALAAPLSSSRSLSDEQENCAQRRKGSPKSQLAVERSNVNEIGGRGAAAFGSREGDSCDLHHESTQ